ncbi:S-adenosyl-L-methionine-dependent methyltransferase [Podospora appendiculata]|uniref:S-adenosyl-L-methionine-dependent methyltransferase n=1 Tax=Podospora appendiculata TaxID=314037 RepID=A0AAE1CD08_9PEZI|nr:S-adenosyl-L-methionine-dependent methyltransferase [Podospora appendiculata]
MAEITASDNTPSPPNVAPIQAETNEAIQVDETLDDGDSALEESLTSCTASLASSVFNYPVEHGRRYHAFRHGNYAMPNDEAEMDRLDMMHAVMTGAIGKQLFLAPVEEEKLHRVLDMGTGTGIWAIDVGDQFPNAAVIGNDLSPIQPTWIPPNVKFEVDDIESEWSHNKGFDFIFGRYLVAAIKDWPGLVKMVYDNLNPGGWAEFQDFDLLFDCDDGTLDQDNPALKWVRLTIQAAEKIAREPCPGPKLEQWVRDAGFASVTHRRFKIPIGIWPKDPALKELGLYNISQMLEGLEGFSLRLMCDVLGWREEEVQVMLAAVRKELKSGKLHMHLNFHVVYGQRPSVDG